MGGFPTRPSRLSFGPQRYLNRYEVQEPDKEIANTIFNLLFWQVAGCGVVAQQSTAEIIVDAAGAVTLGYSAESFDPYANALPVLAKQSTGIYRLTYAASYPDETGSSITTNLLSGKPHVQDTAAAQVLYFAQVEVRADKRSADVRVYNTAFALADPVNQIVVVDLF